MNGLPDLKTFPIAELVESFIKILHPTVRSQSIVAVVNTSNFSKIAVHVTAKSHIDTVFSIASPLKVAVIVPAAKSPFESRSTIVFAVFALVAVVAEFATLPAVVMFASFESVIPAFAMISELVISDVDKLPNASLCTTPAVVNPSMETVPPEDIFMLSTPLVLNDKLLLLAESPVVVDPVKVRDGAAVVPAGSCSVPVMVSPAFATLPFNCVCTAEVVPDK